VLEEHAMLIYEKTSVDRSLRTENLIFGV
jgi:hypothetical protein